jgi:hypothetical protein
LVQALIVRLPQMCKRREIFWDFVKHGE